MKYFDKSLIKSIKNVEKRKKLILLTYKNYKEYKAMTGNIGETELNMYSKLGERFD